MDQRKGSKMKRAGEDVSKYLPALEKYMYEFYISEVFRKKMRNHIYIIYGKINKKHSGNHSLDFRCVFLYHFFEEVTHPTIVIS